MTKINNVDQLDKLSGLLESLLTIFTSDRDLAINNYDGFKRQLDKILAGGFEISEDCALEGELNRALKLVFESSKRLETVIETVSKVLLQQLNNESRERVADKLAGGMMLPNKPVNIHNLIEEEPK